MGLATLPAAESKPFLLRMIFTYRSIQDEGARL
jgi:hypothetical protein